MKSILFSLTALFFASCTNPSTWDKSFNPLNAPQSPALTAEELHSQNVAAITGNRALNKTNFSD